MIDVSLCTTSFFRDSAERNLAKAVPKLPKTLPVTNYLKNNGVVDVGISVTSYCKGDCGDIKNNKVMCFCWRYFEKMWKTFWVILWEGMFLPLSCRKFLMTDLGELRVKQLICGKQKK